MSIKESKTVRLRILSDVNLTVKWHEGKEENISLGRWPEHARHHLNRTGLAQQVVLSVAKGTFRSGRQFRFQRKVSVTVERWNSMSGL